MKKGRFNMSIEFTKEDYKEMEEILSRFLSKRKINLTNIPVDIFKVAADLGFDVRGAVFYQNLDGLILVNEKAEVIKGFTSNKVIAYNCEKNIQDKKFIVAHELAHYIEEKVNNENTEIMVAARDHGDTVYSNDENEQRKDYIAAAILIPKDSLLKQLSLFKEDNISDKNIICQKITEIYDVEYELAERRLKEVDE